MSTYRCTYCDAPLTYADGKTRVPHTSWCPRAPHDPPPTRRQLVADETSGR